MGVLGTLGSLNILLSADTAQFSSAMDKAAYTAERDLQRIAAKAKLNSAVIMTAFVAASTAIAVSVKKTIEHADEIGKMASSLGLTSSQLSSLEYAAQQSGIEIDTLRTSFQRFNTAIFEGQKGIKEQVITFKALDISLADNGGKLKSNYDLLLETADAFSKMEDSTQKSAMAQLLFGRNGSQLIPLLNLGKDGIKQFADEAERLGIVINSDLAAASDRINDNMGRLSAQIQGMTISFTSGLIPVLTRVTENLNSSSSSLESFREAGKGTGAMIVVMVNGLSTILTVLDSMGIAFGVLAAQMNLIAHGDFKGAAEAMTESFKDQDKLWGDYAANVEKNWDAITGNIDLGTVHIKKSAEDLAKKINEITLKQKILQDIGKGLGSVLQSSFEDAIFEGKKFGEVLSSLDTDIEKLIFRAAIIQPLADSISSFFSPVKSTSSHGNIFSNGNLIPFGTGGLITRPSIFPMANGGIGLAGEAGTEAIMPLFRTGSGDLGVKSGGGGGVEVNVYAPEGSNVKTNQQKVGDREQINIMIDEAVAGSVKSPGSKTYKALKNTFGVRQSLAAR